MIKIYFNCINSKLLQKALIEALCLFFVFILFFSCSVALMSRYINIYDEGIVLTAAMRMAAGEMIHRDFYTNYGPAQYLMVSWFFKLLGESVLSERLFDLIVRSGIATITYSTISYYENRRLAIIFTLISFLWLCTVGNHGYPIYSTCFLSLVSTLIIVKTLGRGNLKIKYGLFSGGVTGAAALFRYDIGFLLFLANSIGICFIAFQLVGRTRCSFDLYYRYFLAYALGAALPVVFILYYYLSSNTLGSFFHDVLEFPGQHYSKTRGLPFPLPITYTSIGIYLPIATSIVAFFMHRQEIFKYKKSLGQAEPSLDEKSSLVVFLGILVAIFYIKGFVRVSIEHMQLSLLISIILMSILLKKAKAIFDRCITFSLAILFIVTALESGYRKIHDHSTVLRYFGSEPTLAGFNGLRFLIKNLQSSPSVELAGPSEKPLFVVHPPNRESAAAFIRLNTNENERVYVGLTRHDKIFVNDVSAYFMMGRLPLTKWHDFNPGLQSSKKIQYEIMEEIERVKAKYIWLESTWDGVIEPNDSAVSSGVLVLDHYIMTNYMVAASFGEIHIYERKR